jgi:hypothetical protein
MRRKPLLQFVLAAVLALGLLLPSAAVAKGPIHASASRSGWGILSGSFWDFLRQLLGPAPHLKNGIQIDPDGLTAAPAHSQSDNSWTIDPNG